MERTEAFQIVQSLADGKDPGTGESFPSDSPYQDAQVTRALYFALRSMEPRGARRARNPNLPENAGKPWSETDDEALAGRFDGEAGVAELAQEFKRTEEAIRARLVKLGKLEAPEPATAGAGTRRSNGVAAR